MTLHSAVVVSMDSIRIVLVLELGQSLKSYAVLFNNNVTIHIVLDMDNVGCQRDVSHS